MLNNKRPSLSTLAVLGTFAVAITAPSADPLVQVSDVSPFGALENCGNFPGTVGTPGTPHVDAEVEPWIAVNPTDPNNLVSVWQQDRWSNGGARGNVAGVSLDGGVSWNIVPVPGQTDCTNGPFERSSDPWVSVSPDGTIHQMSLVFDIDPPPQLPNHFGPNGMSVSKSVDGGLTWSNPIFIVQTSNPFVLHDKNSLTADPTNSNLVYAVWDRLTLLDRAGLFFTGPALFARTIDGGDSWQPARAIYNPGILNQTINNQIIVLPSGRLINFFTEIINIGSPGGFNFAFLTSLNKGSTWLPTSQPFRVEQIESIGVITPDQGEAVRDASILFDVAVDPVSGSLYAVWQDARFSGFDQILFIMSTDGGFTWSTPARINRTPIGLINPLRQQAFLPSVTVAGDGTVGVTYYDFRNDDDTGELADHWLIRCSSNCSDPTSWADEIRLTDASFDYLEAPGAGGLFLGDYMGLDADLTDFLPFFQQSFSGDSASGFFRRIRP